MTTYCTRLHKYPARDKGFDDCTECESANLKEENSELKDVINETREALLAAAGFISSEWHPREPGRKQEMRKAMKAIDSALSAAKGSDDNAK